MLDPRAAKVERILTHERQFLCCRYAPDRGSLFAAGFDGQLHRWRLADARHEAFPVHCGWVEAMALHPDGTQLFTADSWGQVLCWPVAGDTLKPRWAIAQAHATWLRRLAISPSGAKLATCGNDRLVRVFSTVDGKLLAELIGHASHVHSVAFHQDDRILVSGDLKGVVKHWDLAGGKCVRELDASKLFKKFHQYDQGGVRSMTFDTQFQTLYCAGFEGTNANQAHGVPTVVAFDWASGKERALLTPKADFKGPILDVVYHPAGFLIGAGSSEAGGALWFWKPGEAKETHMIKHGNSFRGLGLHQDGVHLAAAAFGDAGGQRGGNGRRLDAKGEYPDFQGTVVLYSLDGSGEPEAKK